MSVLQSLQSSFLSQIDGNDSLCAFLSTSLCLNNHEKQVKTSFFALKTILKKVAEKWRFLKEKVADFGADHLETLKKALNSGKISDPSLRN